MWGLLGASRALVADRRAVTALEYGLITALIAVAIMGAVGAIGNGIANTFNNLANYL
jgi:pilus assembly protein Flp/PilA